MLISKNIRLATESDSQSLLEIYAPFIKETVITFEYEVPMISEFSSRISSTLKKYPWIVCEIDDRIAGYAYASKYRERPAYDWSVDTSVYIHPTYHRKKIASALYYCLFEILKLQGFYNAYAAIVSSNTKSVGFHESFGFKPIGVYHNVGYKFDQWHDVKWVEKTIREHKKSPEKPKTIDQIKDTKKFNSSILKALQIIED